VNAGKLTVTFLLEKHVTFCGFIFERSPFWEFDLRFVKTFGLSRNKILDQTLLLAPC
jgi:hypothetical protein